ncbi:plastocyanin/azurin family copper-binding protein [Jannaschia sp. CCS1]|uniref:plastocyanin/azurin family copper-binding protein n=1 Tax=Jannaschia sp. (strain CCS1) TaxID=290400 RepID=UPI000053CC8A|nr:plastocyanin/azurin family copper-binding protein [Jannaschia sp. CCS1]ABD56587.1 blue (type 1) copper domain [Jannaschia sp. CCS1]
MKFTLALLAATASLTSWAIAADHHIIIRGMSFQPSHMTVSVGDTVMVTNADDQPHTVTALARGLDTAQVQGGAFDTGLIAPDDMVEVRITRSGVIDFYCQYHPTMLGRITAE